MNLKNLTKAISECIPGQVTYLNDSTIILNGTKVSFFGNLAQYNNTLFRVDSVKRLLLEVFNAGLLNCSGETLTTIQNKYVQLEGAGFIKNRKRERNSGIEVHK